MTIVPIGENVIIKRQPAEERSTHGIIIPESVRKESNIGKVLALGDGRLLPSGKRSQFQVNEGDRILFDPFQSVEILVDEERFLIVPETAILAILV